MTCRAQNAGLEGSGSKEYLRKLSKGVLRGRKQTAEAGFWAGGVAPYGYKSVPDEFDRPVPRRPAPKNWSLCRKRPQSSKRFLSDNGAVEESQYAIARDLNARRPRPIRRCSAGVCGLPGDASPSGRSFRNPVYTGSLVWNKSSLAKYHSIEGGVIAEKRCLTETPRRENRQASEYIVLQIGMNRSLTPRF